MHHWSLKDLHNIYTFSIRFFFLSFLVIGYFGLGLYHVLNTPTPLQEELVFKIRRGQNLSNVIERLKENGIIDSDFWIKIYLYLKRADKSIKTGDYLLTPHMTPRKIFKVILKGEGLSYKIMIPEGLTNLQIVEFLENFPFLEEDQVDLPSEGLLLPETYTVRGGTTYSTVINFMHAKMMATLMNVWAHRDKDLHLKTPEELLILASVVEKETNLREELPRVAGVFMNRLRKNMKLQSDPTTIYGLTNGEGKLDRPLRGIDTRHVSDYNTYYIKGLPPTPICNPGRRTLEAVAHPERHNYLYFVINGMGGHNFSVDYGSHKKHIGKLKKSKKK
ncbi:MAG: endolytic transglycosylase MltG [Alphaproteobacteria bacterium]